MNPPSLITVNLPDPGSVPPYHHSYYYAPNTLIIDKNGQSAFIGAAGIGISEEDNLIMFKLYKCNLTSEEEEKCEVLREDMITEDFPSFVFNDGVQHKLALLDDRDSFILVYANAGLKVEGRFRDFGKVLSFYRIPKDPQQPVQRLGSITLPNLVNDSRVIRLVVRKVTPDTTYFFILRQLNLEPSEAHLFSFTGSFDDVANPSNWRHEGRIFFEIPGSLTQEHCPLLDDYAPTFMANMGHMTREGYITLWAYHQCPRKLLNDREIRLAVVLFDPIEKKFYNIRGEPVEHVDLGEPEGHQSNAIISIPVPEQFRNSGLRTNAQLVTGQVIVGEKSVFFTMMLAAIPPDSEYDYEEWFLLFEIDRESMNLKSIRTIYESMPLALQGILSKCHLLLAMSDDGMRRTKFVFFNVENNSFSDTGLRSYYGVTTTMAHISDTIYAPTHSLYFHIMGDLLLFFPDNFRKEVKRPIRVRAQPDLASINVNIEFLEPPSEAAVELLDESGRVEWREIIQYPSQTINLSIPLRNVSAGPKKVRVESLVMEETDSEDCGLSLNPSLTVNMDLNVYRLILEVVDHNNVPVSDASVIVEDVSSGTSHSYLTDSSGTAIIEIGGPGLYRVTVRKAGKKRIMREYEVRGIVNDTLVLDPAKLTVIVTDPQNRPVSGATIKLYDAEGRLIAEDITR